MEKGEEENGGENNPNNTNGDGDTLDSGGNGSDETGVDPAEHTGENGTVVVSNGKTDDNRNKKDTNQESPGQSDNNPAPDAADHDAVPPEVLVKTDTSKSKEEPGPGSSSSEPMQRLQVTEHDNGASQFEGDEGPEEAAVTQLLATLYYTTSPEEQGTDPGMPIETSRAMSSGNGITILPTPDSPGQALKLKADGKVPKPSDKDQGASDLSDEKENTNASECEEMTGDESSPGPRTNADMPGEASSTMSSVNGGTTQPTTHSSGEALKLNANGKVPKPNVTAQHAADLSNKKENTNASELAQMTGDGSSPGVAGTTPGAQSGMVPSSERGVEQRSDSLKAEAKEGVAGTTQGEQSGMVPSADHAECGVEQRSDSLKEEANEGVAGTTQGEQSGMVPSAECGVEQRSDSLKEEANEGVPGTTQGAQSGMGPSAEYGGEQRSDSLKAEEKEVNEPTKKPPGTEDNGASQLEGGEEFHDAVDITSDKIDFSSKNAITVQPNNLGDNRASPPENKQSGSENLQSESGSSHAGHAGEKGAEETEAQKRDANGRSEEEMKTGSGANKDDDKEGQPKKKKAKGEGMEGEGGTTHAVKTEQHVIKERSVSISLCTSAYSFNVEGLVSYLKGLMKKHPELIKEVKIHELPYNDLDHYKFDEKDPVDVMILCHSINNRRFAITNVMDALYDEYLPYCTRVVGKEKMGVIVHDFDDMRETVQSSRMSSFKYKQPKAFETTSLQITCGHIEKEEQVRKQMLQADREKIVGFLEHASKYPEEMQKEKTKWMESWKRYIPDIKMPSLSHFSLGSLGRANEGQIEESTELGNMYSNISKSEPEQKKHGSSNEGTPVDQQANSLDAGGLELVEGNTERDPPRGTSPATQQSPDVVHATAASGTQQAQGAMDLPSQQKMPQNSGKVFKSAPQSSYPTPRPISVSVCSSAYKRNVQGLLSWFTKFQAKQPHMITDVVFRELPYNDIDSFRFPPNDPVDVMVLCHSVDNRGFSITNVVNALYEKYLKYCNKLIGKKKLAVIVHDFADCNPATVKGRMESFRRMQPLTFDLVETVIICSRLEDSDKLGIREEDFTRLICFLELARFEPKENFKQSMFGKIF